MSIFIYLKKLFSLFLLLIFIAGCAKTSPNTPAVIKDFDIYKFSGTWYEIAKIQKDGEVLKNTTINYSIETPQEIKIVVRGQKADEGFKKLQSSAKFSDDRKTAALQIQVFGPVYKPYNIVKLDAYRYAMIFGESDEMWIISRTKTISELVKALYLDYAKNNGYDINKIIWIRQN
ncbi:lipocalin family protein [Campylobacter geochelonis]|uniref:Putative outer membrane lipoprotein n=1 Tax=Campylobacter geochelonis TaxID=1780362 RepID=A0A128EFH9_9BACT|nr:lipocalin family protein [Campylobacter geochelonis]QKF71032.1 lipocalin domain-containing protein [Campylobacter geochelonis]CZE47190.1 putative outer membrane lipoprotein [Campylobacter geochelonis]CZE47665.1 putative outer membrane lipoprotein [Campylobacter geochelonis]CZE50152.1 putative outer membrane lipoprotein [Campylobacter geochelonis]